VLGQFTPVEAAGLPWAEGLHEAVAWAQANPPSVADEG
jgi:hypothetical protein